VINLETIINFALSAGRFVILLGVLIFVHELGHFFAAKMSNVYVVRFSLGFGRRLFGFKRGDTDYCVSAIPLGGYVKMVGQEDMPKSREEAEQAEPELLDVPPSRRFDTQSAGKKLAISFAGPLMNLVFAVPLFWLVFIIGIQVPIFSQHTRIGAVAEGSPAEQVGIQPGQRVLSINGNAVKRWDELQLKIWTNEGKPLALEMGGLSGQTTRVTVTPERSEGSTRATIGVEPLVTVAVDRIMPDMPAAQSGLRVGDIILAYDQEASDNESISKLIETVNQSAGRPLELTVLREGKTFKMTVIPETIRAIDGVGFEDSTVAYVDSERADAAAAALKAGDKVTAINGKPVQGGDDSLTTALYALTGDSVELTVERGGGLFHAPTVFRVELPLQQKGMIGVVFTPFILERFGPVQAFSRSLDAFYNSLALTMKTIYFLFSGKVSTREMAGPIGIAFLTEESLKLGIGYYLNLVAFITINLAILNLLPIPILDGGMIFITLVEVIRRKPLDEKYLLLLQRVGFALILLLVLVATFNDILRAINYILGGSFIE